MVSVVTSVDHLYIIASRKQSQGCEQWVIEQSGLAQQIHPEVQFMAVAVGLKRFPSTVEVCPRTRLRPNKPERGRQLWFPPPPFPSSKAAIVVGDGIRR